MDEDVKIASAEEAFRGNGGGHGNNSVGILLNQQPRDLHRGSYTTEELKEKLGVDPAHDLDIVEEGGVFRTLAPGERFVLREGMAFISHVRTGGSS